MRTIVAKNKKLEGLLKERTVLVQEGRDLQDSMEKMKKDFEKLVERQNKVSKKLNKLKDKIVPILEKETAGELGEYEDTRGAEIKGDEVHIEIGDHLEDFKQRFAKMKKESKSKKK